MSWVTDFSYAEWRDANADRSRAASDLGVLWIQIDLVERVDPFGHRRWYVAVMTVEEALAKRRSTSPRRVT